MGVLQTIVQGVGEEKVNRFQFTLVTLLIRFSLFQSSMMTLLIR
jgi:hypothetical protein